MKKFKKLNIAKERFIMDIVHPSMDQLLPKVDSKYTLVVLAAKRARQNFSRFFCKIRTSIS